MVNLTMRSSKEEGIAGYIEDEMVNRSPEDSGSMYTYVGTAIMGLVPIRNNTRQEQVPSLINPFINMLTVIPLYKAPEITTKTE